MVGKDAERLIRTVVEALNRRDWDAALAHLAPDFEYDLTRTDSPLQGVYARDEMRAVAEEFLGVWESADYEPREFVHAEERVVVPFTTHFLGRGGIEMRNDAVWVWTIRDGAIARLALFQDRSEALEAAGIRG
jgi:ketosteroid isomerase-like protein